MKAPERPETRATHPSGPKWPQGANGPPIPTPGTWVGHRHHPSITTPPAGAILIIGKRRISKTAGIWGTPVRHNNTEPSAHVCAALLGRCGSNFEFSKPLAASPASPNPPTAAARRVRSCTTSRAPRGLLLPPTTRHYATVDNAGSCRPTSHPELPCCARSWPAR
jgi:hypothetical protein